MGTKIDWRVFLGKQDLIWNDIKNIPTAWDEGAFLGNGCMGALVYLSQDYSKIHIEVGRNDVYDSRETRDFWMAKQFDNPRLPVGGLDYQINGTVKSFSMRLNIYDAKAEVHIDTDKESICFCIIVYSSKDIIEISQKEGAIDKWIFTPAAAISPRQVYGTTKNQPERVDSEYLPNSEPYTCLLKDTTLWIQELTFEYKTVSGCKRDKNGQILLVHVNHGRGISEDGIKEYLEDSFNKKKYLLEEHLTWWHDYFKISYLKIPDKKLEQFYWIQMYKLACATRENKGVIDNQGPWLTTTPWPGTWWNLNVQLCYWPLYTANRLEISRSLNQYLEKYKDDLIQNVPERFRFDSAGIGTNTTRGLKSKIADPEADNGQQFVELGNLTWVLHNCWLYYKMTMDTLFLRRFLYPMLKRSITYYLHFVYKGKDGRYHLPKTSSPEYGVLCEDCNYDLSLLKWGLKTLLDSVKVLKQRDEKESLWYDVYMNLVDYPTDANGFMIGRDLPYEKSHRHFSHLMMLVPLYLVNRENSDSKDIANRSLAWWHSKRGDIQGFSNVGASLICSAYRDGDRALAYIHNLWGEHLSPNTMYKEAGPVIETPLAAAECIQQLLLQSFGGKIRVFPAMPTEWKDARFNNFAAQGGFVVSAKYKDGKTQWIEIKSMSSEPCIVETDITDAVIKFGGGVEYVTKIKNEISLDLKKGDTIVIMSELFVHSDN